MLQNVPIINPRRACARVTVLVNPRRACAARVTVVVLCVCMCVCPFIPAASHIGITKERYQRILLFVRLRKLCDFVVLTKILFLLNNMMLIKSPANLHA